MNTRVAVCVCVVACVRVVAVTVGDCVTEVAGGDQSVSVVVRVAVSAVVVRVSVRVSVDAVDVLDSGYLVSDC